MSNFIFVVAMLAVHWYVSLFCQTFYLHRYVSHRMFTMNTFWDRFFCVLTVIFQGPSFLRPENYRLLHLNHHKFSDTEQDPHSPQHSSNVVKMMLKTFKAYVSPSQEPKEKFELMIRIADARGFRLILLAILITFYFRVTGSWLATGVAVPLHAFMGPIHGAIVNWCGHKYGYRNFELDDHSKNTLRFDWLMMGELYQNNHHAYPRRANFAATKGELDVTYLIIRLLEKLQIVSIPK